uniref:Heavy metal-associated isoprenylated plant protein 3-like n=1 Tax=Nelumbo nucifera TaxID=4432 RepID=A0A822XS14_NELNU|nr:TPA_asm: hypothetical protein HUJ06_023058 [Nelumbo nucifera]
MQTEGPNCSVRGRRACILIIAGVDKVEIDAGKGVLSVTGTADPYEVITRVKRTERLVEVVSVGPPPKSDDKKPDQKEKEKEKTTSLPKVCERCGRAYIHVGKAEEPNLTCSVM